jgi:hypothetical protein
MNLAHSWHTGPAEFLATPRIPTDSQSVNLFGRPIAVVAAYRPVSGLPTTRPRTQHRSSLISAVAKHMSVVPNFRIFPPSSGQFCEVN